MSSKLDKKTLFYSTCIPFFVFFAVFDAVIYPNAEKLQPSLSLVTSILGQGGVVSKILTHWTSALFYIVSEIYSSVSIGLLFWQFANDVVSIQQAQRFYPLFAQMSGLAPIVAGQYVVRYASKAKDFDGSMHRLTVAIVSAGCMICIMYHFVNSFLERHGEGLISNTMETTSPDANPTKKKQPNMSMTESFRFLSSSKYLRLLLSLVLGYGLSVQFTEVLWKSLLKLKYPDPLDYQRFMGNFASTVGICTCLVIFGGVHVIRILGWKAGAIATPTIMAALAIPFFGCIILGPPLDGDSTPTRLAVAVTLGTLQSLVTKTTKYALFDPTTQMAYIPLDRESKVKGKAAIDVLGSRLGKSGGSLIQQIVVLSFGGNILQATHVMGLLFYGVLAAWVSSAVSLSKLFLEKTALVHQQQEAAAKASEKKLD
uniref:ADP,ATP carrier protein n=1 Tax=Proboscia inermis TaxID=420281 RepID=A0A7S0C5K8_9STRA